MRPFKFYEKIKYSTVADIYTQTFFVAMNKGKYESLPADIKKAIDANTGEQMSITAGKAYDAADKPAYELCVKKGIKIYELPKQERARWIKAASGVADAWAKDMTAKGLPGRLCHLPGGPGLRVAPAVRPGGLPRVRGLARPPDHAALELAAAHGALL